MRPLLLIALCLPLAGQDCAEIVRRSVRVDNANWDRANNYTFTQRVERRDLDDRSAVKSRESETFDVSILHGKWFTKQVAKNDKALSERELRKEQAKLEEALRERRLEMDTQTQRLTQNNKDREKQRRFLQEIPEAFSCTTTGQEVMSGREVWVIAMEPRKGYRPRDGRARQLLPHMRGKLWIDKTEYQWVRAEAEVIDTISLGLGLARLGEGSKLVAQQARVNGEVWLPQTAYALVQARLALVKKFHTEFDIAFRDYRKFQTESRVVDGAAQ